MLLRPELSPLQKQQSCVHCFFAGDQAWPPGGYLVALLLTFSLQMLYKTALSVRRTGRGFMRFFSCIPDLSGI